MSDGMEELRQHWAMVKAAIDELLEAYRSVGESDDDRLAEICESFTLKVDFDSPLSPAD
jgi:D-serine deaminase-like pyridoxal phosphate-dependent protein